MGKNIIIEELDRIKTLMGIIKEGEELDGGPLKIKYTATEKKSYGSTSLIVVKGISNDDKILIQNNRDKDIILVIDGKEVKIGKNPNAPTVFIIGQNIEYGDLKVYTITYLKNDILTRTISMKCFNVLEFDLTSFFSALYYVKVCCDVPLN